MGYRDRNMFFGRIEYILTMIMLLLISSCGSSSGSTPYVPTDVTVPFSATDTSISLDFDLSLTGNGSSRIGNINISGSQGTMVFDDRSFDTIIYASIPWEEAGRHLYQGIVFFEDDLLVYWLYCNTGNSLYTIFYESTNNYGLTQEAASGTCNLQERSTQPSFSVSERNIGINRLVSGFTITGGDISLTDGQSGELTYNGTPFVFYPFQEIDCSDCTGGPWRELHSIAYDASGQKACFTILYLYADSDSIFSSYSICFPELDNINATLFGTWSSP